MLVQHSYQILSVFAYYKYPSYMNPLILHLLHLMYWTETSHPAYHFLVNNSICINEEIGENSLSLLANKLSATKVCKNFDNLRNDFLSLSYLKSLQNDFVKNFDSAGGMCLHLFSVI